MLDNELHKISSKSLGGNQRVDKLVEVYLKNGKKDLILLHIEVQFKKDNTFPHRMFLYRVLLEYTHQKPILSLAILIDGNSSWRPNTYYNENPNLSISMRFAIIKLLDYKNRISELKASNNRFAPVILAQLQALEKNNPIDKLNAKISLTKHLFSKSWKKEDIRKLLNFIDWLITLPPQLEIKYDNALDKIEEKYTMRPYTTREKVLMMKADSRHQEGLEAGRKEGESLVLLRLLAAKFKSIPNTYQDKIQKADPNSILVWAERLLSSQTLEEVFDV